MGDVSTSTPAMAPNVNDPTWVLLPGRLPGDEWSWDLLPGSETVPIVTPPRAVSIEVSMVTPTIATPDSVQSHWPWTKPQLASRISLSDY